MKAIEVNKELRNNIIGYENRLCLYKLNRLYLDYKLFVYKEIFLHKERQKIEADEINLEYNEILYHFTLPTQKLEAFKAFLKEKLLFANNHIGTIKTAFDKYYDHDVKQIDRMISEVKIQQSRELKDVVSVIDHYKKILSKKRLTITANAQYLVHYIQKLFAERVKQILAKVNEFEKASGSDRSLSQKEIDLLIDLNKHDLKNKVEKLKYHYSNLIKPLTDDFDKMVYLIERDYPFDQYKCKQKLSELKSLENENINHLKANFEKDKANVIEAFNKKYEFILDEFQFAKDQFRAIIERFSEEINNLCANIIERNEIF